MANQREEDLNDGWLKVPGGSGRAMNLRRSSATSAVETPFSAVDSAFSAVETRGVGTARWVVVVGLGVLAAATAGMLSRIEPFASFYYLFAWYSTLLAADGVVALLGATGRKGEFVMIDRPAHLLSVLGWSAVIWLFYELLNFRLQNWYYVFLPNHVGLRWVGTVVSFATVLPAVFLAEAVLRGLGVGRNVRWTRLGITDDRLQRIQAAGVVMMALVLVWPRWFFPLVWGATTLFVEPAVYRSAPGRSILGDLEQGRPGRLMRLLLGGAAIGFLWELFNVGARMKWIYTVPGFEDFKLFEMPVLGFFGFPPFAVECFVLWQALVVLGVAVPRGGLAFAAPRLRRYAAAALAVMFSIIVLEGMESRTVSSLGPRLSDLPDVPAESLRRAGYDVFGLAVAAPADVARVALADPDEAGRWVQSARLAALRGIGTEHLRALRALGIESIERLARQDPAELTAGLEAVTGRNYLDARVRVWVRAARAEFGSP